VDERSRRHDGADAGDGAVGVAGVDVGDGAVGVAGVDVGDGAVDTGIGIGWFGSAVG